MQLQHTCPECGEHENIDVDITVSIWRSREPYGETWPQSLILTYTCCNCDHQWTEETDDFDTDEAP